MVFIVRRRISQPFSLNEKSRSCEPSSLPHSWDTSVSPRARDGDDHAEENLWPCSTKPCGRERSISTAGAPVTVGPRRSPTPRPANRSPRSASPTPTMSTPPPVLPPPRRSPGLPPHRPSVRRSFVAPARSSASTPTNSSAGDSARPGPFRTRPPWRCSVPPPSASRRRRCPLTRTVSTCHRTTVTGPSRAACPPASSR